MLYLAAALFMAVGICGCTASDKENGKSKVDTSKEAKYDAVLEEYATIVNDYNTAVNKEVRTDKKADVDIDSLRKKCRDMEFKIHKTKSEMTEEQNKRYRKLQSSFFRHSDMMEKKNKK